MKAQSIDVARPPVGSVQPLTGEIVPAMERVTVPDSAPVSLTLSAVPAVEVTPAPAPVSSPTAWEWTAAPAGIDVTIPSAPAAPATWQIERTRPTLPGVPLSVLLSLGTALTGVLWAAMTSTKTHPAALAAVIMAAVGVAATIGTVAAAVRRDGK